MCVWWDILGIDPYELLDNNQTTTFDIYLNQLCHLKTALNLKDPSLINKNGITLHHDNAHPHTAQLTKGLLDKLGRENCILLLIVLTLLLLIITSLVDYKIFWMVYGWHQEKKINLIWSHILHQNLKNFTSIASPNLSTDEMRFWKQWSLS